jgi:hypothetical protein
MFHLVEQTTREKEAGVYGALPKVALVVSQSHQISELDFESAQRILKSSMKQFPDLYFVFLSNNIDTFKDMVGDSRERTSSKSVRLWILYVNFVSLIGPWFQNIETTERYRFILANLIKITAFKDELERTFRDIPKRIVSPFCKVSDEKRSWEDVIKREEFEEYLSPNEERRYRISSFYLLGSDEIQVKFQGVGYGEFTVCMSRQQDMISKECKSVQDIDNVWFNISEPCSTQNFDECMSVYFGITVDTTYLKCSESDCRFPDDVRIIIRPEGLRCDRNGIGSFAAQASVLLMLLLVVIFVWASLTQFYSAVFCFKEINLQDPFSKP